MAVVSLKSPWVNGDGLPVYFPGDAGTVTRAGEIDHDGLRWTEVEVDLTALATVASGNVQIVAETTNVPKGSFIEEVHLVTTKAATGATATLDVGFVKTDRTTELDFNGLIAAATVASIATLGTKIKYVVGSTSAGALIGTKTTATGLLVAKANTADFTAGKVNVRVLWRVPLAADL